MIRKSSPLFQHWLLLLLAAIAAGQSPPAPAPKQVSVQGMVSNSLTGEPVAHAHVSFQSNSTAQAPYGAITGVDGRFSINAIPAGTYRAESDHRGYEGSSLNLEAESDVKDVVFKLIPTAVISGRVFNQNGEPMEHARVSTIGRESFAETNDKGEFRIGGLRSGRYLVKAISGGAELPPEIRTDGTSEINYIPTFYPSSIGLKGASPVEVSAGGETGGIDIHLKSGPVVRVSGTVAGVPATKGGISVELQSGPTRREALVSPDLKFTIWRLPPGHYQATATSHEPFNNNEPFNNKWTRSAPVDINLASSNIDNIVLTLLQPFEVAGKVVHEDENDLDKRKSMPALQLGRVGSGSGDKQWLSLKPDGTFSLSSVAPGRYRVSLAWQQGDTYVKSVQLGDAESEDGILDLRSGPANVLVVVKLGANGARISGKVSGPAGPAGASVMLLSDTGKDGTYDVVAKVNTGRDGAYSFTSLAPAKYRILAYDPSDLDASSDEILALYESAMQKIEVSEGGKASQDLELGFWEGARGDQSPRRKGR